MHQLRELSLSSGASTVPLTTTRLPCRPTSMLVVATAATELAIVLSMSIDLHPDVPRTVLLNKQQQGGGRGRGKRKRRGGGGGGGGGGSLNVAATYGPMLAVFSEDFRCVGSEEVLMLHQPTSATSNAPTTSSSSSSSSSSSISSSSSSSSSSSAPAQLLALPLTLPLLVKSHTMVEGNGANAREHCRY